ncbi:hypothetical protein ACFLUJ_02130 [Chloroflexota bacterium]
MALAFELTKIPGSEYLPRPEFMDKLTENKNENNIWDILGSYNANIGTITLYEDTIKDFAVALSSPEAKVHPILRELVRLHEHAHAYMHTASLFEGIYLRPLTKEEWFKKLSKEVNESLTEYIALSVLESCSVPTAWITLFHEVDSRAPDYYKRWKQARRLRRERSFIVPTLKFARTHIWKDWDEFYEALAEERDKIQEEAVLLRLNG